MGDETVLAGRRIALAESRELDLMADLLEKRGATALRFPLVAILDTDDEQALKAWLAKLNGNEFDDLLLYTGEGLRRLLAFAYRFGCHENVVVSLAKLRKITRGPKPAKALREIGFQPDVRVDPPTTEGIVATLAKMDFEGRRLGVQLYSAEVPQPLADFISERKIEASFVSPYKYAPDSDADRVIELIQLLKNGEVEVLAFTSASQVDRLWEVAKKNDLLSDLQQGIEKVVVAAVGPVVSENLRAHDVTVAVEPKDSFFMKPLVNSIVEYYQKK